MACDQPYPCAIVYCICGWRPRPQSKALYAATFSGTLTLPRRIDDRRGTLRQSTAHDPHTDLASFPYISASSSSVSHNEYIHFRILRPHHPNMRDNRLLYIAETSDEKQTTQYPIGQVHGGLWAPNIFCDGEDVVLIEVDWRGEVRKA